MNILEYMYLLLATHICMYKFIVLLYVYPIAQIHTLNPLPPNPLEGQVTFSRLLLTKHTYFMAAYNGYQPYLL